MQVSAPFHVAIVGGGLVGLTLAIALKERGVPFTIYESRGSFTEIGAGIGLNPPSLQAFQLVKQSLGEKVSKLATRNPSPNSNVFMHYRFGAGLNGQYEDGETIVKVESTTGMISFHRQELLQMLAEEMGMEHAKFNKKLADYEQNEEFVTLKFEDGTSEKTSILVGCDGIHSRVRATMFGHDNVVTKPHYSGEGLYRAVIPMERAIEALGDRARQSQLHVGPKGYFIMYPVSGGASVNCGAWTRRKLKDNSTWVIPNERQTLDIDFKDWGEAVKKMLALFGPDTSYWTAHHFTHQPDNFYDGRSILIGDSAHAMLPHQGAGAGMGLEDAYVLSEMLSEINTSKEPPSRRIIESAFRATQDVRKPRFFQALKNSTDMGNEVFDFFDQPPERRKAEPWAKIIKERYDWLWNTDVAPQAAKAKARFDELMAVNGH